MYICKVKICGITNLQDALFSVSMGADLIGFNFYKGSPRYIEPADALDIINKIPTFVDTAGIFVNPEINEIEDITEIGFLNWIQLHGDETPDFCDSLRWIPSKIIKAIRVGSHEDIDRAKEYRTDAILLDTFSHKAYGGTGSKFDWNLVDNLNKRIFLAGGINPQNAVQAVETGVYGIDLCSGVESSPGIKDHNKLKQLFDNIKHVRH